MVELFSYDIPNLYIGGSAGIILLIILFWYIFHSQSGRLGEEQQEEKETQRLRSDEKGEERVQRDEKRACVRMEKIISQIQDNLRKGGMGPTYDQTLREAGDIRVMLWRMREEKMSLQRALETFKILHAAINNFVAKLPNNNRTINGLVSQLVYYQKGEYKDLFKEVKLDRDKISTLRRLYKEALDEERGTGTAKAA